MNILRKSSKLLSYVLILLLLNISIDANFSYFKNINTYQLENAKIGADEIDSVVELITESIIGQSGMFNDNNSETENSLLEKKGIKAITSLKLKEYYFKHFFSIILISIYNKKFDSFYSFVDTQPPEIV